MSRLAASVLVLWLLQVDQVEAACSATAPVATALPRQNCVSVGFHALDGAQRDRHLQECLLVRPVVEPEKAQARTSIDDSNCFLLSVLRPEITAAIKRGAETYLVMPRSKRTSKGVDKLLSVLGEAINSTLPELSEREEDVYLLLRIFVGGVYDFRGAHQGPMSPLEKEGGARGIYMANYLHDWVLFEFASFLTGSEVLRAESTRLLKAYNVSSAPPKSYSAKGCKQIIFYNWPTLSTPIESYDDGVGDYDVHWGVCPDDHSLWVYHYKRGWKRASEDEVLRMCRGPERRWLDGLECEDSPQQIPR
jgi:hypothetical protein